MAIDFHGEMILLHRGQLISFLILFPFHIDLHSRFFQHMFKTNLTSKHGSRRSDVNQRKVNKVCGATVSDGAVCLVLCTQPLARINCDSYVGNSITAN